GLERPAASAISPYVDTRPAGIDETSARTVSTWSSVTAGISATLQLLADHRRGVGRSRLGNHVVAVELQPCEVRPLIQPNDQFIGDVRWVRLRGAHQGDGYPVSRQLNWPRE